jgi:diaminohydroxyphosphoribosylaminopyrimidine deaminase/5-amino-6-(5-phosphoribosylamino)uracil reductase
MDKEEDKGFIRRCFELAANGIGNVSPNPLVGAVIVKDGKILSEGYHRELGSMHAEVDAIVNAGESVHNATLYCNLEPCCHNDKKTPPCVSTLIPAIFNCLTPLPATLGLGSKLLITTFLIPFLTINGTQGGVFLSL